MDARLNAKALTLAVVCGLPGTGKTTLAMAIGQQMRALHLNTDRVRVAMGLQGNYSPDDKAVVYAAMYRQAEEALEAGCPVVLDGTFSTEDARERVRALALESGCAVRWIEVKAPEALVAERVALKRAFTEADYSVYLMVRGQWQPLHEPHLVLWSAKDNLELLVHEAMAWLREDTSKRFDGMRTEDIAALLQGCSEGFSLVETHISWVILGPEYVFKIRKPVRYAFLDFSSFGKREADCRKELALNRRFSPEVYLDVVPVRRIGAHFFIGEGNGELVDHAVRMQRLDSGRQMDVLLQKGKVGPADMKDLADTLAAFHERAERSSTGQDAHALWLDFADILKTEPFFREHGGDSRARELRESAALAGRIVHRLDARIKQRMLDGFVRDGHGDLHSRNIFLLDRPVLFDCLEFNDHLRQVDLLSEIAFLGMDLHAFGRDDLWEHFLKCYQERLQVLIVPEDRPLLDWFLWYRANVRLKVQALRMMQDPEMDLNELEKAWKVYRHYAGRSGFIAG